MSNANVRINLFDRALKALQSSIPFGFSQARKGSAQG